MEPDRRRTLVLHPLTQEVYHVPNESLLHDSNHPVVMPYDAFEKMGATGQLSGERLLHHDRAQASSFNVSQIVAVRLRQRGASSGGRPTYAWASRMVRRRRRRPAARARRAPRAARSLTH